MSLTPALAQTFRVMVACCVTFALVQAFGLPQGAWAIFTVLIVMQGSLGATAGAARDRLIATVAGAVVGGLILLAPLPVALPHHPVALAAMLVLAIGVLSFAAGKHAFLRAAPLTAAVVVLTHVATMPVSVFVLDRILEITLGGVVGVLASRFILPVPSKGVMINQLASVLETMAELLNTEADALEQRKAVATAEALISMRNAMVAADTMLKDAQREKAMGLVSEGVSDAIPRTLWRIRNGITHIGGLLDQPLAEEAMAIVGPAATGMLRSMAQLAQACARGLTEGAEISPQSEDQAAAAFDAAFTSLQQSDHARDMPFDAIGRVFGLAFALRKLHQDFQDLAARITESRSS